MPAGLLAFGRCCTAASSMLAHHSDLSILSQHTTVSQPWIMIPVLFSSALMTHRQKSYPWVLKWNKNEDTCSCQGSRKHSRVRRALWASVDWKRKKQWVYHGLLFNKANYLCSLNLYVACAAQLEDCGQIRGRRTAFDLKHMSRTRQCNSCKLFWPPRSLVGSFRKATQSCSLQDTWALQSGGKKKAKDGEIFILNH